MDEKIMEEEGYSEDLKEAIRLLEGASVGIDDKTFKDAIEIIFYNRSIRR